MQRPLQTASTTSTVGPIRATTRTIRSVAARPAFEATAGRPVSARLPLQLAVTGGMRGPEKYRILEAKRRRAQIRARRALESV